MPPLKNAATVRAYRNRSLYRALTRTLRVFTRRLIVKLHQRGFEDFSPAFPPLLSNLDTGGTTIGVLALRAGVTRQGAGQLLREIERCGYVERKASPHDARSTIIQFTARGRRLLSTIFELVDEVDRDFAAILPPGEFERVRAGLATIADEIDPKGAFGIVDQRGTTRVPVAKRAR